MIKKFLLTSAALLSVTGAFAQQPVVTTEGENTYVTYGDVKYRVVSTQNGGTATTNPVATEFVISNANGRLEVTASGKSVNIQTINNNLEIVALNNTVISLGSNDEANLITGTEVPTNGNDYEGYLGTNASSGEENTASKYASAIEVIEDWINNVNLSGLSTVKNTGLQTPYVFYYYAHELDNNSFTNEYIWNRKSSTSLITNSGNYLYKNEGTITISGEQKNLYTAIYYIKTKDNRTTQTNTKNNYVYTTIPAGSFEGNSTLTTISLGSSIATIEAGAFRGASKLTTINTKNNTNFVFENGILYTADYTTIVAASCDVDDQEIDSRVTTILSWAFANAKKKVYLTSTSANTITVGPNQNEKVSVCNVKATLTIPTVDANGGYTISDAVTPTNIADLITKLNAGTVSGTYIVFDGTVTADLNVLNNTSSTLLFFNTGFTVSGTNVINGEECNKLVIKNNVNFYNPKEFSAKNVEYQRTFTKDQWSTVCLPFAAVENTFTNNFLAGSLKNFDSEADVFNFTYQGTLAAYKPYIIKATTGNNTISCASKTTIPATSTNNSAMIEKNFSGTMSRIEGLNSNSTTSYFGFSGGVLKKLTGANIPALRAYLHCATSALAPSIRLVDELDNEIEMIQGEATGIKSVSEVESNKVIYNMNGQRVNNYGKPGVYTVNGKKVIVK